MKTITRRGFLKGLAALPFIAALWPRKAEAKEPDCLYVSDHGKLWRVDKHGSKIVEGESFREFILRQQGEKMAEAIDRDMVRLAKG